MVTSPPVEEQSTPVTERGTPRSLSTTVDWLVTALMVLVGALFAALGAAIYGLADYDAIAEMVADGTITSTELTDAELIDVTYALIQAAGIGLAVTGALLFVGGIVYLWLRTRSRREHAEAGRIDSVTNAIVGALVTVVTGFIPFSPVLGGAVAGYLQRADHRAGTRVGGLSGLVASAPLVVVFAALIIGFAVSAVNLNLGFLAVFVGLALLFAFGVSVVYMVALSALGGYLGVALSTRPEAR